VTVTTAINSRISAKTILGVLGIAEEVSKALAQISTKVKFWELDEDDLKVPPSSSKTSWQLWRAWYLLMGVHGVDLAVCHKILHHKRPSVFPLLDRVTEGAYPRGKAWVHIQRELAGQKEPFDDLEEWFGEFAKAHHGVPLTRLRLHDILLWCHRSGESAGAAELGGPIISPGSIATGETS
jgi:hypothetical protein